MRLLIAAGGTGGHIYPGMTIAQVWQARHPDGEVLFVGTARGLEKDIIPRSGWPLRLIRSAPLSRRPSWKTLRSLGLAALGLGDSIRVLRDFRPDLVVGTGGYAAGPVLAAAILQGLPTLIQEQNAFPGLTNRLLSRFAGAVALGYAEAAKHLSPRARIFVTGNPVRPEIVARERDEALHHLGLQGDKTVLLVLGASQGARTINNAMIQVFSAFLPRRDLLVIHQTGKDDYERVRGELEKLTAGGPKGDGTVYGNIWVLPYIHDMPEVLACTDLVVARAGAISIAELTARGLPCILVPFPFAAENHQEKNARVLEREGAGVVILDQELTGPSLLVTVEELLADKARLQRMAANSRRLGRPRAAWDIVDLLDSLL
ncbi:MAG: undecaprenyldiphospho-muramoylpentapeptide beta-N-acetylglucosaminyltransferase [Firmicutes bacterium]|nr:undecaprenyldiphospho-muramoylpentapeptide beta-N-acetylglucosaminyltransferase [Bacillota bacterium]